jgi:hypothetical protein
VLAHAAPVNWLAFNPAGDRLVTASGAQNALTGAAQVWNADSGEAVGRPFRHGGSVVMAEFDPAGKRILTAVQRERKAHIWRIYDSQPVLTFEHDAHVFAAVWSPDGRFVATGSRDQTARRVGHHHRRARRARPAPRRHRQQSALHGAWPLSPYRHHRQRASLGPRRQPAQRGARPRHRLGKTGRPQRRRPLARHRQRTGIFCNRPRTSASWTHAAAKCAARPLPSRASSTISPFSADAATLALAVQFRPTIAPGKLGEVRLHEFTGAADRHLLHDGIPTFVAFAGNTSPLLLSLSKAAGAERPKIAAIWNREGAMLEDQFEQPEFPIDCAAIAPTGDFIATGVRDDPAAPAGQGVPLARRRKEAGRHRGAR